MKYHKKILYFLSFSIFFLFFSFGITSTIHSKTLFYSYKVSRGGISRTYGLKIFGNGKIYFLSGSGRKSQKKIELPVDVKFTKKVFFLLNSAKHSESYHIPCGAPHFGILEFDFNGEKQTIDMFNPNNYARYGVLIRFLERRLTPLYPDSIESDCMAFGIPSRDFKKIKNPLQYDKYSRISKPHSPFEHFQKLTKATSEEISEILYKISITKRSDPFFSKYLINNFRLSSEANNILKYHSARLVYSVSSCNEAKQLLKILKRHRSLEKYFFSSLLYLTCNNFEKAASKMEIYLKGTGRKKESSKFAEQILNVRNYMGQLNYGGTTWTRQIITISQIFKFWYNIGMLVDLPDINAFPLAKMFYLKAFHYARKFAGNLKIGQVPLTPTARKKLPDLFLIATSKPWWTRTPDIQYDIMSLITVFRLKPEYFGGISNISQLIPPLKTRIYELVKMRRLKTADKLIEKYSKNVDTALLEYEKGKALLELESFNDALDAFKKSESSNNSILYDYLRFMLNGIDVENESLNEPIILEAALKYLRQYHHFKQLKQLMDMLNIKYEKMNYSLKLEYIKTALLLGKNINNNLKRIKNLTKLKNNIGLKARLMLAEIYINSDTNWEVIYNLLKSDLYGSKSVTAWGLIAVSTVKQGVINNNIFALKAIDEAEKHPVQMLDIIALFTRYGMLQNETWLLSQKALTLYQDSSILAFYRAIMLFRSKKPMRALFEAFIAENIKPKYPPYKKLSTQIYEYVFKNFFN